MMTRALAVFALMISALPAHAENSVAAMAQDDSDKKAPLHITSDQMVTDKKKSTITFTGSVVAIKGKLKLESDEMVVWTDEERSDFNEIIATGSVIITKEDKIATGDKAHYYADGKKIVLTGNPTLKDGQSTAKGKRVVYFFDRDDMVIFGSKEKRSTVVLYPKEKDGENAGQGTAKTRGKASGSRQ